MSRPLRIEYLPGSDDEHGRHVHISHGGEPVGGVQVVTFEASVYGPPKVILQLSRVELDVATRNISVEALDEMADRLRLARVERLNEMAGPEDKLIEPLSWDLLTDTDRERAREAARDAIRAFPNH